MSLKQCYISFRNNNDLIDDINNIKMDNDCVKSYNDPIYDRFNSLVEDEAIIISIFLLLIRIRVSMIILVIIEIIHLFLQWLTREREQQLTLL